MSDIRPTPECDKVAFVARKLIDGEYQGLHDVIPLQMGERLERERDEAREELENWKASGVHSCHHECKRPLCVANRKIQAMREAIREAHAIIERYSESAISHSAQLICPECLRIEAFDERHKGSCSIGNALAKLQPFLK